MTPEELDRLYRDAFLCHARRLLGQMDQADDMVQEAIRRYSEHYNANPQQFRRPQAWVMRVVGNLCRNELRRRAGLTELNDETPDRETEEPPTLAAMSELRAALNDCVRTLTDEHRQIFELVFIDELTLDAIVQQLGSSRMTIARRRDAARNRLQRCLSEKGVVV